MGFGKPVENKVVERRRIQFPNENPQEKFCNNKIITAKYTPFTFLPKFLFEEFSKLGSFGIVVPCILTVRTHCM